MLTEVIILVFLSGFGHHSNFGFFVILLFESCKSECAYTRQIVCEFFTSALVCHMNVFQKWRENKILMCRHSYIFVVVVNVNEYYTYSRPCRFFFALEPLLPTLVIFAFIAIAKYIDTRAALFSRYWFLLLPLHPVLLPSDVFGIFIF